jgi:hypothetical protein
MLAGEILLIQIDDRLESFFAEMRDGGNSSPASRFQLEGLLQAAVTLEIATQATLWQRLSRVYSEVCGVSAESVFGEPWNSQEGFPALPVLGRRAPVYPTTKQ